MAEDPNETAQRAFGEGPATPPPLTAAPPAPPLAPPVAPRTPAAGEEGALAAWGTRAAAFVLDTLFLIGLTSLVALGVVEVVGGDDWREVERIVYAISLPLCLLYPPLLMARTGKANGQTFGKQMMDIRVVRVNGERVTFWNGFLRYVIGQQLLMSLTFLIYAPFDYLWPLRDPRNQALHDKIARTLVVRTRDAGLPQPPATSDARAAPSPRRVDEAPVGDWLPPRGG